MTPTFPPKGYATVSAAARRLGISRQRLHILLAEHYASARVRYGQVWLVPERVIAAEQARFPRPSAPVK